MHNLADIIEACKLNEKPSTDELRYAVIALASLMNIAVVALNRIYKDDSPLSNRIRVENVHRTYNTALNKSPKEWLDWDDDPENPQYQSFHTIATKMLDIALKGELASKKVKDKGYYKTTPKEV